MQTPPYAAVSLIYLKQLERLATPPIWATASECRMAKIL
ncbi:hypothetical protein RCCS2_16681 [Roseobacter sp. CCS2]|nr:hypothetical protein RCCS2_16681 [Roseobacter sp. CCS2]